MPREDDMSMPSRIGRMLRTWVLWPSVCASIIVAIGLALPVRLDRRAMQDLAKLQDAGLRPGASIVFVTATAAPEMYRVLRFGLQPLAFPSGDVIWLSRHDHAPPVPAAGDLAVGLGGTVLRAGGQAATAAPWMEDRDAALSVERSAREGAIVVDSSATREWLVAQADWARRCPQIVVLGENSAARNLGPEAVTWAAVGQWAVRLALVVAYGLAVWMVMLRFCKASSCSPVFVWMMAVPLAVGLAANGRYVASVLGCRDVALLIGAFVVLVASVGEVRRWQVPQMPDWRCIRARPLLALCLAGFGFMFMLGHALDGDFFYNWLPQAKSFHHLGMHAPEAILARGSMQGASYPPGFGSLFSMIMWAANADSSHPFLICRETAYGIFLYRCLLCLLYASFLGLLAACIHGMAKSIPMAWLGAVVSTMLLVPVCLGNHSGAESLMVPLLGASTVLLAAGRMAGAWRVQVAAVMLAGWATLFKWEAAVLMAVCVLPWTMMPVASCSMRVGLVAWLGLAGWLCVALVPVVAWRMTISVFNDFFRPLTLENLILGVPRIPGLARTAGRYLLQSGHAALLIVAAPCAMAVLWRRYKTCLVLVVPFACYSLYVAWALVFVLSNQNPVVYLETSYPRLVMIPTVSMILYCAVAAADWCRGQANLHEPPESGGLGRERG